jgi:phage tail sheath protein FI
VERHAGEVTRSISAVPTSVAAVVGGFARGPRNDPRRVRSAAEFDQEYGGLHAGSIASYAIHQFFLNGGQDAWIVRAAPGGRALIDAFPALDAVDVVNVLCIPDTDQLADADAAAVYVAATAYAVKRRAMYLLDAPNLTAVRHSVPAIHGWLQTNTSLRHSNVAMYFPRPLVADPLSSFQPRPLPPSGTIAGLFARVDGKRGVWKAPAGTDAVLRGVHRLERQLTEAENRAVNTIGLNALRTFEGPGHVCWGARTLVGADAVASEWKFIPVRRLALQLEASLERGLAWVAAERNDEALWSEIRRVVAAFLQLFFIQGAFQGRKPEDGYFVKCDRSTMTQADIDNGTVNVVIGFAPLKPAEFVVLRIGPFISAR